MWQLTQAVHRCYACFTSRSRKRLRRDEHVKICIDRVSATATSAPWEINFGPLYGMWQDLIILNKTIRRGTDLISNRHFDCRTPHQPPDKPALDVASTDVFIYGYSTPSMLACAMSCLHIQQQSRAAPRCAKAGCIWHCGRSGTEPLS